MFLLSTFVGRGIAGIIIFSVCARSLELSIYGNIITCNDLLLFEEFTLGPVHDKSKTECAQECHKNSSCTTFSISLGANHCQLYGDVEYPDVATAHDLPGRRYYVNVNHAFAEDGSEEEEELKKYYEDSGEDILSAEKHLVS